MEAEKKYVLAQLKEHLLFLQRMKKNRKDCIEVDVGEINRAFPNEEFPTASIHEFINDRIESVACTKGFISYIIGQLMLDSGVCVWVSSSQTVYPPSLKQFFLSPEKIVFIRVGKEKEMLWVIEEALKCEGISAVVGEVKELSFLESRRLQLAVERSRVTGFIIRNTSKQNINACVSRWRVSPIPSDLYSKLPGVGFPRWNIELLKIRNGKPGVWQMEFAEGKLYPVRPITTFIEQTEERKAV